MGKSAFGLHRRERSVFLAEIGKPRPRRSKAGPGRSRAALFEEKGYKNTPKKGMDGSVVGPHRREQIAFLAKFGEAGLGHRKAGLGRSKTKHFHEKSAKWGGTKVCLDCTGVSGSRFLRKTAKCGLGAVKQGRGAANQWILVKKF